MSAKQTFAYSITSSADCYNRRLWVLPPEKPPQYTSKRNPFPRKRTFVGMSVIHFYFVCDKPTVAVEPDISTSQ